MVKNICEEQNTLCLVVSNSDTDLAMNTGYELVKQIKKDYPGIKIIVMSGGGTTALNYYIEIMEKKLAKTISKPFTKDQLKQLVDSV